MKNNRWARRAAAVGAGVVLAASGAVAVPGAAFADDSPGCSGTAAQAKGGPGSCSKGGHAPIGKREGACYENAMWTAAPGILTGNAPAALAGVAVGCAKGASGR
ncbi:hypothetical protein H7X46_22845 [Pseudonocardia sp. C8]|uniref:hypothetical protein n=1 Tax=Pseudonocardia sp. C8 TaxID=2762759 RepID=UPI0016424EE8|nr:hypothetical protein [Pseudonocardia sp. C8]MBC3193903.1 hypothetical protein [Pseudonocardia sp. C8]